MKETYTITLLCVFCDAPLQDEGKEYQAGDLIKCSSCGEDNDYKSIFEIAKEKGIENIKNESLKELKKAFK